MSKVLMHLHLSNIRTNLHLIHSIIFLNLKYIYIYIVDDQSTWGRMGFTMRSIQICCLFVDLCSFKYFLRKVWEIKNGIKWRPWIKVSRVNGFNRICWVTDDLCPFGVRLDCEPTRNLWLNYVFTQRWIVKKYVADDILVNSIK